MESVVSQDGTRIAYEKRGDGPALILVLGAFNDHSNGIELAQALAERFTVYNYDRRGKGESGDNPHYSVEREIEDLGALISKAGGHAYIFGHSSGAVLSVRAAAYGLEITKLALYEPPPAGGKAGAIEPELSELIAADRRAEAVKLFLSEAMAMPPDRVAYIRNSPYRAAMEKMARTTVYESDILKSLPTGMLASIHIPTLMFYGEKSSEAMRQNAQLVAEGLPECRLVNLSGQTHEIVPEVLAPLLREFFAA